MNPFIIGSGIAVGVCFFALALTLILTSVIVGSSLDDSWLKPGEQLHICKNKEFTVNPAKDTVIALVSPTLSTDRRITNEAFDGTVKGTSLTDISRFRARYGDTIDIELDSTSFANVEVYYYDEVTTVTKKKTKSSLPTMNGEEEGENDDVNPIKPRKGGKGGGSKKKKKSKSGSSSKTSTKLVRFIALAVNGTGSNFGSVTLPGEYEYGIGIGGTAGGSYEINITYSRKYYTSSNVLNCTPGQDNAFNSGKQKGYCAAIEMVYDGPITDPNNATNNVDLYCEQRYTTGDIVAIVIFVVLFVISLVTMGIIIYLKVDGKLGDVEMS